MRISLLGVDLDFEFCPISQNDLGVGSVVADINTLLTNNPDCIIRPVQGDFYPDPPVGGNKQTVNLTEAKQSLVRFFYGDEDVHEIIFVSDNKFILVDGEFYTERPINITFISPYAVFFQKVNFTNFEAITVQSPTGLVYLQDVKVRYLNVSGKSVITNGDIDSLSVTVQAEKIVHNANLTSGALAFNTTTDLSINGPIQTTDLDVNGGVVTVTGEVAASGLEAHVERLILKGKITGVTVQIEVTTGLELLGEIYTNGSAVLSLHGSRITVDPQAKIEVQGLLQILQAYEFINPIVVLAKEGIIIVTIEGVVNDKVISTNGTLLVQARSFVNNRYMDAKNGMAEFRLQTYFSNTIGGLIQIGGFNVSAPDNPDGRITIFTNLGVMEIGKLGNAIYAQEAHFKYSRGNEKDYHQSGDPKSDRCRRNKWDWSCTLYLEQFKPDHTPIPSIFSSESDIVFNVLRVIQEYSKIYTSQQIKFLQSEVLSISLSLNKKIQCTGSAWEERFELMKTLIRNYLKSQFGYYIDAESHQAVYMTYNPIMHAAGGFEGNLNSITISTAGTEVPQLAYSNDMAVIGQESSNALTLYGAQNDRLKVLSNIQVTLNQNGIFVVTVQDSLRSVSFFPTDFAFDKLFLFNQFGYVVENKDSSGPLIISAYNYWQVQDSLALVQHDSKDQVRLLADVWTFDQLFKDSVFKVLGSLRGLDNNKLFQILAQECDKARKIFGIAYGEEPNPLQVKSANNPMACPIKTANCYGFSSMCLNYKIFFNDETLSAFIRDSGSSLLTEKAMNLNIHGNALIGALGKMKAGEEIRLNIAGHAIVLGAIEGGRVDLAIQGNFISAGSIKSVKDLSIAALNIAILGELEAGNDLTLDSIRKLILQTLVVVERYAGHKYSAVQSKVVNKAKATAGGNVVFSAGDDVDIVGAKVGGERIFITAGDEVHIIPAELYNALTQWGKRYYYNYQSLRLLRSELSASKDDIQVNATGNALFSGVLVNSGKDVVAFSKEGGLDVLNPSEYESLTIVTKEKGWLGTSWFGGSANSHKSFWSDPVGSSIRAVGSLLGWTYGDQNWVGTEIKAYAVKLEAGTPEHQATISLLPAQMIRAIEVHTAKGNFAFKFGHGQLTFYQVTEAGYSNTEITNVPTIFQVEDQFIGQVNGSWVQLSSQIIADNEANNTKVIINATSIELGAVPDIGQQFIWTNKYGTGIGFSNGQGEYAVKLYAIVEHTSSTYTQITHEALTAITGDFVQLTAERYKDAGVIFHAEQMSLNAKIIYHGVLTNEQSVSQQHFQLESGIKLGIRSNIGKVAELSRDVAKPDELRAETFINKAFMAWELYHNILVLLSPRFNHGISKGTWFYVTAQYSEATHKVTQIVPTMIDVSQDFSSESEELHLVATQYKIFKGYIQTRYLDAKAGQSTVHSSSNFVGVSLDIPIVADISPNLGVAFGNSNNDAVYNFNVHIYATTRLTLDVRGAASMSGITIDAGSLVANFDSLILESVQDIIDNKALQTSFGLNPQQLGTSSAFNSFSLNVQNGQRHAVAELSRLFGRDFAHIVVAHALQLNGAMIASAQIDMETGEYTDHGHLTLEVGKLFVQHIHNYDDGNTLGLAVSILAKSSEKNGQEDQKAFTLRPTFGFKQSEWDSRATIGKGDILVRDNPEQLEQVNRDVTQANTKVKKSEIKTIKGYVPINHDFGQMPNSLSEVVEGAAGFVKTGVEAITEMVSQVMGVFAENVDHQSAIFIEENSDNPALKNKLEPIIRLVKKSDPDSKLSDTQIEQALLHVTRWSEDEPDEAEKFFAAIKQLAKPSKSKDQCLVPWNPWKSNGQTLIPEGTWSQLNKHGWFGYIADNVADSIDRAVETVLEGLFRFAYYLDAQNDLRFYEDPRKPEYRKEYSQSIRDAVNSGLEVVGSAVAITAKTTYMVLTVDSYDEDEFALINQVEQRGAEYDRAIAYVAQKIEEHTTYGERKLADIGLKFVGFGKVVHDTVKYGELFGHRHIVGGKFKEKVPTEKINVDLAIGDKYGKPFTQPPYGYKKYTHIYVTNAPIKEEFVRLFADKPSKNGLLSRADGAFIIRRSDLEIDIAGGLTIAQIADKYGLPNIPSKIVSVELPAGVNLVVGKSGRIEFTLPNGKVVERLGGGRQYQILQKPDKSWFPEDTVMSLTKYINQQK
jgi:hypothetical protein